MYKIKLDDNSFIIADEEYQMTLFHHHKKKTVTVREYLNNRKLWKYHLVDFIEGKKIKRYFVIDNIGWSEYASGTRLKFAKDIKENDLVIAPDGSPRKVKELHTGEDDMYEINVEGKRYTVNGGHILALVDKDTGEHLEIPVNIYLHMDDEFKSHWVMEKIVERSC